MGMYGHLRRITPAELERLRKQSGRCCNTGGEQGPWKTLRLSESALERVKKTATEFPMSGKATDPVEERFAR